MSGHFVLPSKGEILAWHLVAALGLWVNPVVGLSQAKEGPQSVMGRNNGWISYLSQRTASKPSCKEGNLDSTVRRVDFVASLGWRGGWRQEILGFELGGRSDGKHQIAPLPTLLWKIVITPFQGVIAYMASG